MNKESEQKIIDLVTKLTEFMNLDCQVQVKSGTDELNRPMATVSIYSLASASSLIGRNGQNLKALEHVLRTVFSKEDFSKGLTVDVNDYRKIKANQAIEIARQAVAKVRSTQRAEALSPMSAYERRMVHMELASYPDITTESIGEEPQRRIVVKLYP